MRRLAAALLYFLLCGYLPAQTPQDTGAPQVAVTHSSGQWTIAGRKNSAVFHESDFSIAMQNGAVTWKMMPSSAQDLLAAQDHDQFPLRLADAGEIKVTPYETGFKTGIKITLDQFRNTGQHAPGAPVDLRLTLTMCLEGGDEDLIFESTAIERGAVVRELNWPKPIDGREVDYTVIPSSDGTLLPRNWPKSYHPIHRAQGDNSVIQSHLIESWSISWWGFEKGAAAMMVIVETPDDAGYTFSHPAGGPTFMGPSWRAQLTRFGYLRSLRMAFFAQGN